PDATQDLGAKLQVATPDHEALRTDRAEHQLAPLVTIDEPQDIRLAQIFGNELAIHDGIDAEQRLGETQCGRNGSDRAAWAEEKESLAISGDDLGDMARNPVFDLFVGCFEDQLL